MKSGYTPLLLFLALLGLAIVTASAEECVEEKSCNCEAKFGNNIVPTPTATSCDNVLAYLQELQYPSRIECVSHVMGALDTCLSKDLAEHEKEAYVVMEESLTAEKFCEVLGKSAPDQADGATCEIRCASELPKLITKADKTRSCSEISGTDEDGGVQQLLLSSISLVLCFLVVVANVVY